MTICRRALLGSFLLYFLSARPVIADQPAAWSLPRFGPDAPALYQAASTPTPKPGTDVIVTVQSQTSGSTKSTLFSNLEHTPTKNAYAYEGTLNVFGYSDANVLNSSAVDSVILCVLNSSASSACPAPATSSVSSPADQSLVATVQPDGEQEPAIIPHTVEGRVEAIVPSQPFKLLEPNEILLKIRFPGLTSVRSDQWTWPDEGAPSAVDQSNQTLPILHRPDGTTYIAVVPLRLGKVRLYLSGNFPDGGIFYQDVMLDVIPPDRSPEVFHIGGTGPAYRKADMNESRYPVRRGRRQDLGFILFTLDLRSDSADSFSPPASRYIYSQATYDGATQVIPILPELVAFKVTTQNGAPTIHLDEKTGIIDPLQPGHALIEATFGGVTDRACVVVKQSRFDVDRSQCEDLLPPAASSPQ
jgi:hypothetical protein